jgi:hypothetical protein
MHAALKPCAAIQSSSLTPAMRSATPRMATNRVFGVDLNPVAVELAQISLWLNTIYEGHTIPWFGAQLAVGNSLIGARRQVFTREQIVGKERAWLEGVPERVKPGEVRLPFPEFSGHGEMQTKAVVEYSPGSE